ncbi:MAG TPA: hypothetical protein VEX36_10535 [Thermoleophilaceae bacterium]|nr:hypothetical protein [Thermoleophilaceae bacterium]
MNVHRSLGLVAAAGVVVGAVGVAPAMGQDRLPETKLSAKARATPSKAGTKRHPRGVAIDATARVDVEPGFEPPIVTGVDILVGKGLVWNADDYVKCSKPILDRKGPDGCPRKSIMGDATATARADTVLTTANVVLVNGGWKRTFAFTTLYNPAFVEETIVVKRTKLSGRWAHRESFKVPENLQIVAGVPIQVVSAKLHIGGKPYARDYIVSTACPSGGWKYRGVAHYLFSTGATSQQSFDGSIPCTK